ncbi:hypothetical protein [uncultured Clostridium sp.]|nr:hypothetical protein [uncultured Clostridium sp.]
MGLKQGLDVDKFSNPEFTSEQMEEIREGLEDGLDVGIYADPSIRVGVMK